MPGSLRLDEHGKLQLPSLEKAVPEQAEYHSRHLATFLPRIPLADLLLEVDNWTGFLRHLTHLSTGMATTGSQRLILVAGLGDGDELWPLQNGGFLSLQLSSTFLVG